VRSSEQSEPEEKRPQDRFWFWGLSIDNKAKYLIS